MTEQTLTAKDIGHVCFRGCQKDAIVRFVGRTSTGVDICQLDCPVCRDVYIYRVIRGSKVKAIVSQRRVLRGGAGCRRSFREWKGSDWPDDTGLDLAGPTLARHSLCKTERNRE